MSINCTIQTANDGFGAQYQKIIQTYIYCKLHNYNFLYKPFSSIEHNYDNDNNYIEKVENLINLKNNIPNININNINSINEIPYHTIRNFLDNNVDMWCDSEHMNFVKDCFWKNKSKNYFNNNKINVAIHIRRENSHDKGLAGERATTPNSYYLNIMNFIREKYKKSNKRLLFHIYSQGNIDNFKDLDSNDVKFYIDFDIFESFIGMVSAEILVISPSSFSYVAALISDGEIYYKPFWHNPRRGWNMR